MVLEHLPAAIAAALQKDLVLEIYGDLAKPGVQQVGKALGTVLGLGNTLLWHIQLLNERGKIALEANLERYREQLSKKAIEDIAPVAPEVGVPIAEKLAYVSDIDLREMYTSLLAKASTFKERGLAHPSFVNILSNLSPDEAHLLQMFLRMNGSVPSVQVNLHPDGTEGRFRPLTEHFFLCDKETRIAFKDNVPAYVSNMHGLGLIHLRFDRFIVEDLAAYTQVEAAAREAFSEHVPANSRVALGIRRVGIELTSYGRLFLHACTEHANGG